MAAVATVPLMGRSDLPPRQPIYISHACEFEVRAFTFTAHAAFVSMLDSVTCSFENWGVLRSRERRRCAQHAGKLARIQPRGRKKLFKSGVE